MQMSIKLSPSNPHQTSCKMALIISDRALGTVEGKEKWDAYKQPCTTAATSLALL